MKSKAMADFLTSRCFCAMLSCENVLEGCCVSGLKKSPAHPIREAEYLAGEPLATVRHEYIDGDVSDWLAAQAAASET